MRAERSQDGDHSSFVVCLRRLNGAHPTFWFTVLTTEPYPPPLIRPHLIFFASRVDTILLNTACNYVRASPRVKRSTVDAVGDGVAITALCREACLCKACANLNLDGTGSPRIKVGSAQTGSSCQLYVADQQANDLTFEMQ